MYYQWGPYVSVAERRRKAEKAVAKLKKKGLTLSPVTVATARGAIAKTFWGKAWCANLEHYSDYSNRLPRGRSYVRNGAVIDLKVAAGEVQAQVMGSSIYKVVVSVATVQKAHWQTISADCAGSIDTLIELLQGRLSKGVMERICRPQTGLFPSPQEITFKCSCPDWADMCKHVAAVLYGVGARLDEQPELLFTLRRVNAQDLVESAGAGLRTKKSPKSSKVLDHTLLADVFGIEMAEAPVPAARGKATGTPKKSSAPKKSPITKKSAAPKKPPVSRKPPEPIMPAKAKKPAKRKTSTSILTHAAVALKPKRGKGAK